MPVELLRGSRDGASASDREGFTSRKQNPHYMARFVYNGKESGEPGDSGSVALYLPENFQMNFSSSFGQPFSQGIVSMGGIDQMAKFMGGSLTSQSMSVQVWQGTACPEFNMTFQLIAEDDPVKDIMEPIKQLSRLALPGEARGLLTPPGPRISIEQTVKAVAAAGTAALDFTKIIGGDKSATPGVGASLSSILQSPENNVSLHIGHFLYFPSVVIQSVSQTYDTIFDDRGIPLKASIDVTISTWYVPVKSNVNTIFSRGPANVK